MAGESNGRITVSEETLRAVVGELRLELVREIQGLKKELPDEDRVRVIARQEIKEQTAGTWTIRAAVASIVVTLIAVATFSLTVVRGTHASPSKVVPDAQVANTNR